MWCAADNYNDMCHICAKELLDSNFKQLFTKYQILMKLSQIRHIHKNRHFLSIIGTFKTNRFFPTIDFMTGTCKESTFSFYQL